ncbi:MAG: dihydrofolate reductase family protein [Gammaproteobacteria bacterium]
MQTPVTRLYPAADGPQPLEGLYLQHQLHLKGRPDAPYIYSNFITTLDGRIALGDNDSTTHTVPGATVNPRDWRLYQELAGQADLLMTSGRYFRQSLIGEAQDQLPVAAQAAYGDIREWRLAQGLREQPDIAILSGSLDIPIAALEPYRNRRILVMTGETSDPDRARALQEAGIEVVRAGAGSLVDGGRMVSRLAALGYRSLYAIAGPAVFHTLLEAKVLDRLYLTIAQQLLGGDVFDTLTRGPLLTPPQGMTLVSLYHDPHAPAHAGQLLAVFEPQA